MYSGDLECPPPQFRPESNNFPLLCLSYSVRTGRYSFSRVGAEIENAPRIGVKRSGATDRYQCFPRPNLAVPLRLFSFRMAMLFAPPPLHAGVGCTDAAV